MQGPLTLRALWVVLPLAAAACAPSPSPPNTLDARVDGSFFYRCANGERVEVRFTADAGVAVLIRGDSRTELDRQPTRSGFIYQAGGTQIAGTEKQITLVTAGTAPLTCVAD